MERIRGFKARRGAGARAQDAENSGDSTTGGSSNNSTGFVLSKNTKKRDQLEQAHKVSKMSHKELEQRFVELQAKLDDTETFYKDDCRHKDKRIAELERTLKAVTDTKDHLDIKLKMVEQELVDLRDEKDAMRAHYEQQLDQALKLSRANAAAKRRV